MKIAAVLSMNSGKSRTSIEPLLAAQSLRATDERRVFAVESGGVGFTSLVNSKSQSLCFRADCGNILLVSGAPFSTRREGVHETLRRASLRDTQGAAEILSSLEGAFAAVFWDDAGHRLTVVTDIHGLQPIYMAESDSALLVATELKGIAAGLGRAEMDLAGWGAFIGIGHTLGDTVMLQSARRVPAASIVTWDAGCRARQERRYWGWPEQPLVAPDTGPLVESLSKEVEAVGREHPYGTVLLSGGFDSRLILSLLLRSGFRPSALAVAHKGERLDADGRFALETAASLDVPVELCTPRSGFYGESRYLDYLAMNEVANPSLNLFIASISAFIRPELRAVWEGVAPGYTLAFPRIPKPTLACYLTQRVQTSDSATWLAARSIFRQGDEMGDAFERQLAAEVADCVPGDAGLLQFEARHQMRNRMGHNPLKVYTNDVLCFTPGVGRDYWSLAARIPLSAKQRFKLYFDIFRNHFPKALDVPFCSMGQLWSDRFRLDPLYHFAKLFPPPGTVRAAGILKRFGLCRRVPSLVRRVIAQIDPAHPDLNPNAVLALQRGDRHDAPSQEARALLFYWQVWRWLMEGSFGSKKLSLFPEPISG